MTARRRLFSSTQAHNSSIYQYTQKKSGYDAINPWEIYFYLLMYLWFFVFCFFSLSIMILFTSGTKTYNYMLICYPVTTWWGLFSPPQVHSTYYTNTPKKYLGRTLLTLEKYIFICSCIYHFCRIFHCQ